MSVWFHLAQFYGSFLGPILGLVTFASTGVYFSLVEPYDLAPLARRTVLTIAAVSALCVAVGPILMFRALDLWL